MHSELQGLEGRRHGYSDVFPRNLSGDTKENYEEVKTSYLKHKSQPFSAV